MWAIGSVLIFLAIKKKMEPSLLLPMGFRKILVNLPELGAKGVIDALLQVGIEYHELFYFILFIGIGAMIDFEPLITNPKLMFFGVVAQFGVFFTLCMASLLGFEPNSVALIGFLMFGNLIRECGVLNSLSETAQNVLANLITIFLGITIASKMTANEFLRGETLLIM